MEVGGEAETWELSKENIQPLKQGRNASVLSVALDDSSTRKLNSIRHEFEEELRTYSGDDPLDVWYRYVLWVEQNFPKGGKDSNLKKLIQKCITSIHSNSAAVEKYQNDERFLSLWIKYANICPNPLEVYSALESKGLCTGLAEYYMSWSWELERIGNFRRADAIYKKGIEARAIPFDVLEDAHKKFQSRVARATVEGRANENEADGRANESEADAQRIALTALKTQGKKNRAPNERVGPTVLGPAGRVSQSVLASNACGPTFSIFQDNGHESTVDGGNGAKGGSLPIHSTINKENVKNPTKWTKAKVSQKTSGVVPVEDLGKHQKLAFAVHEDTGTSQSGMAPSKLPETSNVLSVRKDFDDWNVPLFVPEPFDPKVQPQYCKHKVYCGTEEFSLEELRAAAYFKEERRKKAIEEKEIKKNAQIQQMQDMIKKQEMVIQHLCQNMQHVNPNPAPEITVTSPQEPVDFSVPQKVPKKSESRDKSNFHDSWVCMNKSVTAPVNQSVNVSNFLEESSTKALLQLKPATLNSINVEIPEEPEHNSLSCAPNNSGQDGLNHSHSSHSNSRGLNLTDPTVNTKMAMNAINEMWSASLFKEDSVAVDMEPNAPVSKQSAHFAIFQDDECEKEGKVSEKAPSQPFSIFSDDGGNHSSKSAVPFTVFQDEAPSKPKSGNGVTDPNQQYPENQDENAPPEGFKQEKKARSLAGVLQPTTNVPVSLNDEEDKIEENNPEREDNSNDKDDNFEDDFFPINGTMIGDFTLKMPNNPEAFAKNLKIASTPAFFLRQDNGEEKTFGNLLKGGNFFPVEEEEEDEEKKEEENSGEVMPPPSVTRPILSPPALSAKQLSPIMEASREYKSSSSSSSGYSTTSTTLGSNSIHGITHCGGFSTTQTFRTRHHSNSQAESVLETGATLQAGDFTKSGYLADKSRGESIAESRPNTRVSKNCTKAEDDDNTFDPHKAAMMLLEMDKMSLLSTPKSEPKGCAVVKSSKETFPEKINPFCKELIVKLLSQLNEKVEKRGGYVQMNDKAPVLKPNMELTLGSEMFYVRRMRGEGAYAKVFQATTVDPLNVTVFPTNMDDNGDDDDDDDDHQMILKLQKPAWPWEFYICHELRSRLKAQHYNTKMLDSMMRINRGYFFSNASILVNKYHKYGTLLEVVNRYKLAGQTLPEDLVILFMIEVMSIVEALHNCNIIHADIKPDNFLIRDMPDINYSANTPEDVFEKSPSSLKLIDFGRSIDMQLLPEGSTFTEQVTTEGFTCCEMREGKPWTYETDYYGVAAIAYCFLFGSYMDVKKNSHGKWELKQGTIKRYWQRDLWQSLFSTFLNSPPPNSMKKMKDNFVNKFVELEMHNKLNAKILTLKGLVTQKK